MTTSIRTARTKPRLFEKYFRYRVLFLMFLPVLVYYFVFQYLPMYGLIISFKNFRFLDGIWASPWVGLANFRDAFTSSEFWDVFQNTLIISALKLLVGFPAPLILALMLNEVRNHTYKRFVQTATYLPHFLSWVVLAGVTINFLSPSSGPVNMILKNFGVNPVYFIGSRQHFVSVLVWSSVWKDIGWGTIVYLAALSAVNPELYEACRIDGAGRIRQTLVVTLPAIAPVITIMLIFAVGAIVNDDFDQIYNLYNPAVYSVADVLSTYIYRMGLENMLYSYTTAIGLFKNLIAFVLVLGTNALARRYGDYCLW